MDGKTFGEWARCYDEERGINTGFFRVVTENGRAVMEHLSTAQLRDLEARAGRVEALEGALRERIAGLPVVDEGNGIFTSTPQMLGYRQGLLDALAALSTPSTEEPTRVYYCAELSEKGCIYPCETREECENLHAQATTEEPEA